MKLLHGDCLDILPTLADNSVHAVICDPPYHLTSIVKRFGGKDAAPAKFGKDGAFQRQSKGFMGKTWDGGDIANRPELWAEVLRVARPGARLLAFGGTRTYHRMACAIEDAGWIITDCIFSVGSAPLMLWVTGQGFPKSKNIGCKCRGLALQCNHEKSETGYCEVCDVREAIPETSVLGEKMQGEFLQQKVRRHGEGQGLGEARAQGKGGMVGGGSRIVQRENAGRKQSRVEGRDNFQKKQGELYRPEICSLPEGISANGAEGRIHNGAPTCDGNSHGEDVDARGSRASQKSQHAGQSDRESGMVPDESSPQDSGGEVCKKCGGLKNWIGYGSALKPSVEPIVLAMKPLEGTYAENVLKWGCGGLNIDAARIGSDTISTHNFEGEHAFDDGRGIKPYTKHQGRWPANLLFSHNEDCEVVGYEDVAAPTINRFTDGMKPFGNGAGHAYESTGGGKQKREIYRCSEGCAVAMLDRQSGGASKFFFQAKVDLSDFSMYNGGGELNKCGQENTKVEDMSAGKRRASKNANSKAATFGSKPTGLFQRDTISIIKTKTGSIITFQILSALTEKPIGICTILSDKTIPSLAASSIEGVSVAENTSVSIATTHGVLELGAATVRIAPETALQSGTIKTGSTITPICENTKRENAENAVRYFYCAKVSPAERNAGLEGMPQGGRRTNAPRDCEESKHPTALNSHPTLKPIALLRYLAKLVTPTNGVILDPFMGSGSMGCAAALEGFDYIGIEKEREYFDIAEARIKHWAEQRLKGLPL